MSTQRTPRIGFIGLGNMGGAMAVRLVAAQFAVVGYDPAVERADALVRAGGAIAGSIHSLAEDADVVLLSVPGPRETEGILLGSDGLLQRMRAGTAVINASTVSPELMRRVEAKGAERGIDVLDAPVTGAADGARAGTLTFMVGASDEALARWRIVFEPLSSIVIHTGAAGTGSAAKLLTNLLWFTHVVALSDVLAAAAKCGITPATMRELVPVSAGASWVSAHDMPNILAGDDDESFTLALCCKDLALISALCEEAGAPTVLLQAVEDRFRAAAENFGPSAGELAVARLSEAAAGVSVRGASSDK
jgi:3-hydroxyisobutyrate dehydrogenase